MRLVAVNSPKLEVKETEKPVEISLEQDGDGNVYVKANGWYLLHLRPNGTLKRCRAVDHQLGFQLDEVRRIKLSEA